MSHGIVSLHVGQAGIQLGSALWELLCLEHNVCPDGATVAGNSGRSVIFSESAKGQSVPRAVLCDLDPTCIDEIKMGNYRHLFGKDYLISGKEDASSNYARGYYSIGNEESELIMDRLRRQAEKCETLKDLFIFRSFGGGTGSGLGANLMTKMKRDFEKVNVVEFSIYPAPRISPVIVEPYNAVLTTHATMESSSCNFLFDNEAIYEICEKKLSVQQPTYTNLNRIIAQVSSAISCSSRFPCEVGSDVGEAITNLIPFPRLHFPLVSFAPLVPDKKLHLETLQVHELVSSAFRPDSQMVKVDPRLGTYLASVLFFRGDVSPAEINVAVGKITDSKEVRFVDYSPAGFKVGGCRYTMSFVQGSDLGAAPASLACMSNSTALEAAWARLGSKFDLLFSRRAFVHHYVGEGMEEAEFTEAREDLKGLEEAYQMAAGNNQNGVEPAPSEIMP